MISPTHSPICLSIAGFDPSGGAGIHADLKSFQYFKVYGAAVTTLIAVQNSMGVSHVETLSAELVKKQIDAVLLDFKVDFIKIGALGTPEIIESVVKACRSSTAKIILDPVFISSSGKKLISDTGVTTLINSLLPKCYLICPNLAEASAIANQKISSLEDLHIAAKKINSKGVEHVLITGGHTYEKTPGQCCDILYSDNSFIEFSSKLINSAHTHGTGCAFSSAITACLANGKSLKESIEISKAFISKAILSAPQIGSGAGPLNFLF